MRFRRLAAPVATVILIAATLTAPVMAQGYDPSAVSPGGHAPSQSVGGYATPTPIAPTLTPTPSFAQQVRTNVAIQDAITKCTSPTVAQAQQALGGTQTQGGEWCNFDDYTHVLTTRSCPSGWICVWTESDGTRKMYLGVNGLTKTAKDAGSRFIAGYPAGDPVHQTPPCTLLANQPASDHVIAGNFDCSVPPPPPPTATPVTLPRGNEQPVDGCRLWFGYATHRLADGGCKFDTPIAGAVATDTLAADEKAVYTKPGAGALTAGPKETISMTSGTIYIIQGCQIRPPITKTSIQTASGTLQFTLSVNDRPGVTGNKFQRLDFGSLRNVEVDVPLPNRDSMHKRTDFSVTPPEGTTTVTVTLHRLSGPGQDFGVYHIVLKDNCGEWPTFLAGGVGVP